MTHRNGTAQIACTIALSLGAQAAIVLVPQDQPTIQAGLDAAAAGDTVLVAAGTYSGVGNKNLDFGGIDRVLLSTAGAEATVIDGQADGRGFDFHGGETESSVVRGFTITGGRVWSQAGGGVRCVASSPSLIECVISGNEADGPDVTSGGGLGCSEGASPTLYQCRVVDNWVEGKEARGGGLACAGLSSPTLSRCAVARNEAEADGSALGGGLYCSEDSAPALRECVVSNNGVRGGSGGSGGGIYCSSSLPTLTDCAVSDNFARGEGNYSGAAFYCAESSPVLTRCTISRNWGRGYLFGGGFYCYRSSPVLHRCTISENHSTGLWCRGSSSPTLIDCTITRNSSYYGGGLKCLEDCAPVLTNCTVVGNSAPSGAGMYCSGDCFPILTSCILRNHGSNEIDLNESTVTATYSNIRGGWDGEGNIDADPRFCDGACWQLTDLGLAADSPCAGTGFGGGDMGARPVACDAPLDQTPTLFEIPGDFPTLRAAFDVSCDGDTIVVAPGTHQAQ